MGLIKTGIKVGAVYFVAKKGMEAYEKSKADKQHEQYSSQQQPRDQQQPQQYPHAQPSQQFEGPPRQLEGTFHQHWCNRQCGGKCVSAETLRSIGVDVAPAPQYDVKAPAY
ncbi:hypothetical protein LTR09_008547 [Extremus antarcticus]|uniref:Uncharacterized protein n=1 Tax=Extremus antarcticus TaxID=702011 RepID=A0AAJ0G662_9PEZI|nr:hypothetical protein LTR09_008547 [Extremus antarcticus]